MTNEISSHYEQELEALELRVSELINLCQDLRRENHFLRHQQTELSGEHAELTEKNALARSHIQSMISRLKTMEQEHGQ